MKLNNILNLQNKLSVFEITATILPAMLVFDFIIDYELDYAIVITEILIHIHISHMIPINMVCNIIVSIIYALNNSLSLLEIINLHTISIIYNIIVNIICITLIFYFIDHKKLTSRFSTTLLDTLFHHYKEVNKALIAIP